jgi:site-specific DNA-methyltransferase (adenine-specific)
MSPYYSHNGITIYHGDCRDLLPMLDSVDLILTDPPYGVQLGDIPNNQRFDRGRYGLIEDSEDYVRMVATEIVPLCWKRAERTVLTPGVKNLLLYPKPSHIGSFYYPAASGCNSWGFSCWQPILFYGSDPYGGEGSRPDSYLSVESAEKNGHPCPKPLGQWKWLLKRTSKTGHRVIDPMMGSGTTLEAARDFGMEAIGIELEEKYCEIAAKRLSQEVLSFE